MDVSVVNRFAQQAGYGSARLIGPWRQFVVFEAIPEDRQVRYVSLPDLILVEGDRIELADYKSAIEFLETYEG